MLIDSNTVSIDCEPLTAAVTGKAVPLASLLKPGRQEPVCVYVRATEKAAGGTSVTITIQQSDAKNGTYTDAASATVALADLTPGKILGWRWLPPLITKQWLKIKATPTGEFTAGKIFAAVVREDPLEYEDGMYIDKGYLMC